MKRIVLLVLVLAFYGLAAQIDMLKARQIIIDQNMTLPGESFDMKPQTPAEYAAGDSYWVWELRLQTSGPPFVMIPVSREASTIPTKELVAKTTIRIHYLANFFETTDSIKNFLRDARSFAETKHDAFQTASNQFISYEVQTPENITLLKLNPLLDALNESASKSTALVDQVLYTQNAISNIQSTADANTSEAAFENTFSRQQEFLDSVESVSRAASEFEIELGQKTGQFTAAGKTDLVAAFQSVVSNQKLKESVTTMKGDLTTNQNTITGFFDGLDVTTNEYYAKFADRLNQSAGATLRNQVMAKLAEYSANYTSLFNKGKELPAGYRNTSGYDSDLKRLFSLINDSQTKCATDPGQCAAAQQKFSQIDALVLKIDKEISGYKATCSEGAKRQCTKDGRPGTQTCTNKTWGECVAQPSASIDMTLVAGLIGIIVLLFVLKKFSGRKPKKPEEASPWAGYKFCIALAAIGLVSSGFAQITGSAAVDQSQAYAGELVKLSVTLNSDADLQDVIVRMLIPPQLGDDRNASIAVLRAGQPMTVTKSIFVRDGTPSGEYQIRVLAVYRGVEVPIDTASLTVAAFPLSVDVSVEKSAVGVGETNRLTVSVKNTGGRQLSNVSLSVMLPEAFKSDDNPLFSVSPLAANADFKKEFLFKALSDSNGDYSIPVQVAFYDSGGKHVVSKQASVTVSGASWDSGFIIIGIVFALFILLVARQAPRKTAAPAKTGMPKSHAHAFPPRRFMHYKFKKKH